MILIISMALFLPQLSHLSLFSASVSCIFTSGLSSASFHCHGFSLSFWAISISSPSLRTHFQTALTDSAILRGLNVSFNMIWILYSAKVHITWSTLVKCWSPTHTAVNSLASTAMELPGLLFNLSCWLWLLELTMDCQVLMRMSPGDMYVYAWSLALYGFAP